MYPSSQVLLSECVGNHFRPQNNYAHKYHITFSPIIYYCFFSLSIKNSLIRPLCNRLKILDSCTSCIVETYRYSSSVSSLIPIITLSSYYIPCYYFISAMTEKLDFTLFRLAHLSHPMMAET